MSLEVDPGIVLFSKAYPGWNKKNANPYFLDEKSKQQHTQAHQLKQIATTAKMTRPKNKFENISLHSLLFECHLRGHVLRKKSGVIRS